MTQAGPSLAWHAPKRMASAMLREPICHFTFQLSTIRLQSVHLPSSVVLAFESGSMGKVDMTVWGKESSYAT